MKASFRFIATWIRTFWMPLLITIVMLGAAGILTAILLAKQEITVNIPDIPIRVTGEMTGKREGTLKRGERLVILKEQDSWYKVRRSDESTGWVASWLVTRKDPIAKMTPLAESTIVLDPGHGGSDTGALSIGGKYEKTYTLQLAKEAKKAIQATGARVVMTRQTDKIVPLAKIPLVGEKAKADAFISFHYDSSPEANSASGFTAYYYHKNNGSYALAKAINQSMSSKMPLKNRGVDYGDFLVIRDNSLPAILLENGYINNDDDFKHIKSKTYQKLIAKQIPVGLNHYFSEVEKSSD